MAPSRGLACGVGIVAAAVAAGLGVAGGAGPGLTAGLAGTTGLATALSVWSIPRVRQLGVWAGDDAQLGVVVGGVAGGVGALVLVPPFVLFELGFVRRLALAGYVFAVGMCGLAGAYTVVVTAAGHSAVGDAT